MNTTITLMQLAASSYSLLSSAGSFVIFEEIFSSCFCRNFGSTAQVAGIVLRRRKRVLESKDLIIATGTRTALAIMTSTSEWLINRTISNLLSRALAAISCNRKQSLDYHCTMTREPENSNKDGIVFKVFYVVYIKTKKNIFQEKINEG